MTDTMTLKIDRDTWGRLVVTLGDGTTHVGIEPIRCFPLSDPNKSIALLDMEGHELLTLPSLDSLDAASRKVVESELAAREFVPVIQRVISTSNPNPPCIWSVETDRGPTKFQLESEDDIRKLELHRVLIADANGIRYLIPDIQKLDAASQKIVRRLV